MVLQPFAGGHILRMYSLIDMGLLSLRVNAIAAATARRENRAAFSTLIRHLQILRAPVQCSSRLWP